MNEPANDDIRADRIAAARERDAMLHDIELDSGSYTIDDSGVVTTQYGQSLFDDVAERLGFTRQLDESGNPVWVQKL